MSEIQDTFIEKILNTLESNGFPAKKVSLPTEKLYEAADNKDLSLNTVLEQIKATGIESEITPEKIIFSKVSLESPLGGFDPSKLKDMSQEEVMKKAQEFMKSMTPDQMSEVKNMYANMSQDEKDEVMKKGKDMGLL